MGITVGVIGAGIIAEEHLMAMENMDGIRSSAVVDIDEQKAKRMALKFNAACYKDYREMIETEAPDLVVITLPHYLHKEAAVFSAGQGCHILLEKPMALNSQECEEIIRAAEVNGVHLMVGHIQHYFQENITAKRVIKEGRLGELLMINETRHMSYFTANRPKWFLESAKSGGGIVMNLGAHCIDKLQWITNTRFTQVLSKLTYQSEAVGLPADVEGSGLLFLKNENDMPVTISLSGYEVVPKHVTELIFTHGMMKVEAGKGIWMSNNGVYEKVDAPQVRSPFEMQLDELLHAIKGEKQLENTGSYAKSIIEVIEGIYQSHRHGELTRVPVKFS